MLKVFSFDPVLPCPTPCSLLRYFSFQLFSVSAFQNGLEFFPLLLVCYFSVSAFLSEL